MILTLNCTNYCSHTGNAEGQEARGGGYYVLYIHSLKSGELSLQQLLVLWIRTPPFARLQQGGDNTTDNADSEDTCFITTEQYQCAQHFRNCNIKSYGMARSGTSKRCTNCDQTYTTLYRVTDCAGGGGLQRHGMGHEPHFRLLSRNDYRHIPQHCLKFPSFTLCTKPKHNATIWTLSHMLNYRIRNIRI
jgi:hypothetical protein